MDFQQPHRYMRPPPPPPPPYAADPHHQQPPRQPGPPPGHWFPGQFQYHHHPPTQHSPSPPPPPHHHQWAQQQPPPYPAHHLHNQYPPPRPSHAPPPYPLHPHAQQIQQQSYHQVNQDWGNLNQGHQGWEYPVHNNEEDWAARAKAWAAEKVAIDSFHPQSQFAPVVRPEEQSHYHDQYQQNADPYYASSYQQYPALTVPPHGQPISHMQESASVSSGQPSYTLDGHLPYTAGDSNVVFPHQESSHASPSVHQQEVPSSYSSVAGKEEAGDQSDKFYKSLALPIASTQGQYHVQPPLPAVGRSVPMEQSHYMFGNHSAQPISDLSDQPLDFAPRFSREHDLHMQPSYSNSDSGGPVRGFESVAPLASVHTWDPSVAPGVNYPPIPSGPQHDPSLAAPSPVSGHSAPMFGRMPGPSFQPLVPPVGAPFGIGTGPAFHPTAAFPGDVYGVSSVSERPKKASVPNWLREEIIKKKAVIATSAPEDLKEESQSIEDEGFEKSVGKGDNGDSKSVDSSRSTEEDDDDEDYVEATRTAAINQEIKRVLTEVLLKVTDELFDEIATKVLNEGDLSVEVDHSNAAANHKVFPSTPSVPTPKASAKILIPAKPKDTDSEDVSGKSVSNSRGDVLGLASYASDDDEDDGIQSSTTRNSEEHAIRQQPSSRKFSEDVHGVENGSSQAESIGKNKGHAQSEPSSGSPIGPTIYHSALASEFSNRVAQESADSNLQSGSSKMVSQVGEDRTSFDGDKKINGSDASKSKGSEVDVMKTELPVINVVAKDTVKDESQGRETRNKSDKNDRRETRRSSSGKESDKEARSVENKADENDRHVRKGKTDDRNVTKERVKEHGVKSGERAREHDSRKRSSHPDLKDDKKERERGKRAGAKEDSDRKKRGKDEKGDRARQKHGSESSGQKRRRSSSISSRGRNSKDNLSSDEPSDDYKRKLHSKRPNLSPSPVRSRRRQVSRSPHSNRSQRRHSPYSSLETNRGRRSRSRSRSRSPVRRER